VSPRIHEVRRDGAPAWADPLATLLDLLERVRAAEEALVLIHAKMLGARVDGAEDALRIQVDDYRSALARLQGAAEETPNAAALAAEALEADDRFGPGQVAEALEAWRSGRTVDAAREVWRENGLPEEAFDDLLRRTAHIETAVPLGEGLLRTSALVVSLAEAVAQESAEALRQAEA